MNEDSKPKYKRPVTDAQRAAVKKYDAANTRFVGLKLNRNTDADIIRYLEFRAQCGDSIQGTIKECIRYAASHTCIDPLPPEDE